MIDGSSPLPFRLRSLASQVVGVRLSRCGSRSTQAATTHPAWGRKRQTQLNGPSRLLTAPVQLLCLDVALNNLRRHCRLPRLTGGGRTCTDKLASI
jgi:hypothetical protein